MAAKLKLTDVDKLNTGMKSILSEFKDSCDKVQNLEDNNELYNEMQAILKSLSTEEENTDYGSRILNLDESVKNEQSFYLNKTGTSLKTLPSNLHLDSASKILQETGVDNYNSSSLFTKYMSMIEKCKKQKEFVDDIDENINKLKILIEQQNELKCELSNLTYNPVGYTAELVDITPTDSEQTIENSKQIIELIKKIADFEKKNADICKETSDLKLEQKKSYHGLPPSLEQATIAVQMAEKTMKSVSKQLVEKLGKN